MSESIQSGRELHEGKEGGGDASSNRDGIEPDEGHPFQSITNKAIATGGKPTEGIQGGDGAERGRDGQEEVVVRAGLGFAEERLHLAPHHLYRVQVGRVSGLEAKLRPGQ